MTPERELWACANHMHVQHGADAPRVIAERIGELALEGDLAGVQNWRAIAERYTRLFLRPRKPIGRC